MLVEKEAEVCPSVSAAHGNCGLLVPSDVTPLAAPGALGQGLRWLLDSASPFYIAPRPSGALLRWLWLYRAAATAARARAAAPVLRDLQAASAALHDKLAADEGGGGQWLYHRRGLVQAYETAAAMAAAVEEAEAARALGVRADVLSPAEVRGRFPAMRGERRRRPLLPRRRPHGPGALHARHSRQGGRRRRGGAWREPKPSPSNRAMPAP